MLLLEAIRRNDLDEASKLLVMWRSELEAHGQPAHHGGTVHPFAPNAGELALPEDYLDVFPANFILRSGALTFIDREWVAPAPVSAELVEVRALWWLARELVECGEPHPWGSLATIEETCQALGALAGVVPSRDRLARWRLAEAELQHLVNGGAIAQHTKDIEAISAHRTIDMSPRALPFTALRASLDAARQEVEAMRDLRVANEQLRSRLEKVEDELSASRFELKAWVDRMARIERRLPVLLYRKAQRFTRGPARPIG